MANDYFYGFSRLVAHTIARSEILNTIYDAIVSAFDKFPSLKRVLESRITYAVDSGTVNSYVLTLEKPPSEYNDGFRVHFKPLTANAGASVVNVYNASAVLLGAVAIKRFDGNDLQAGDLPNDKIVEIAYNSNLTAFQLMSPITSAATVVVSYGVKAGPADTAPNDLQTKIDPIGRNKERLTAATGDARLQIKTAYEGLVIASTTIQIGGLTAVSTAGGVIAALYTPPTGAGDTLLQDGDMFTLEDQGGNLETNNATILANAGQTMKFMEASADTTLVWNGPNRSRLEARWNSGTSTWIINGYD